MAIRETKELTINSQTVKVHAIATGFVAVRTKYLDASRKGLRAVIDFFRDKDFAAPMPIWTWVIEHPEGIFLIDAGEVAEVNNKDYFKSSGKFNNWLNTTKLKFYVNREDEIDIQLSKLNIKTSDVKKIVFTHLHLDHTGGIKHFKGIESVVHRLEWNKPVGNLPKLYPPFFTPTLVDLTGNVEHFGKAHFLTNSRDLFMVHTPGHTRGHCSVILKTDTCNLFFAGDICFYEQQLIENRTGLMFLSKKAMESYGKIKQFATSHPTVFLPSHDIAAQDRLRSLITL